MLEQLPSTTASLFGFGCLRVAPWLRVDLATVASFAALDPFQLAKATNSNLVTVPTGMRTDSRLACRLDEVTTENAPEQPTA